MHLKLPLPSHESEPRLLNARINFLCRVISTSIENAIKKSNSTPDTPDDLFVKYQFSQSQSYSQQVKCYSLIKNLIHYKLFFLFSLVRYSFTLRESSYFLFGPFFQILFNFNY